MTVETRTKKNDDATQQGIPHHTTAKTQQQLPQEGQQQGTILKLEADSDNNEYDRIPLDLYCFSFSATTNVQNSSSLPFFPF
jgi:hypothetical protein